MVTASGEVAMVVSVCIVVYMVFLTVFYNEAGLAAVMVVREQGLSQKKKNGHIEPPNESLLDLLHALFFRSRLQR